MLQVFQNLLTRNVKKAHTLCACERTEVTEPPTGKEVGETFIKYSKTMGIWKTDNSTHEHYHVSKEAAKEQRKAAEAAASARRSEAYAQEETARIQAESEQKMLRMQMVSEKADDYRSLGREGTADAYRQLYSAYFIERDKDLKNRTTIKASLTGKKTDVDNFEDVEHILESFPYTKVPGEFEKIFIFLVQECKKNKTDIDEFTLKQMENMETVAEMNARNPEIAELLPFVKKSLAEMKELDKKNTIRNIKIFVAGIAAIILLFAILYIFG